MTTPTTTIPPSDPPTDAGASAVECDHDWEFQDDSFDHEFGCEVIRYWQCAKCEATRDTLPHDGCFDDPDPED